MQFEVKAATEREECAKVQKKVANRFCMKQKVVQPREEVVFEAYEGLLQDGLQVGNHVSSAVQYSGRGVNPIRRNERLALLAFPGQGRLPVAVTQVECGEMGRTTKAREL
jgi:hypothetical protein